MDNRVIFVIQDGSFSYDNRVKREARSLQKAGYEVEVVCPRWEDDPPYQEVDGIRVHHYPVLDISTSKLGYVAEYGSSLWGIFVRLLRIWQQRPFDVLHLASPPDILILAAAPFKRFGGVQIVFDHHDVSPEMYMSKFGASGGPMYRLLLWLERLSCRTADRVIATNESFKEIEVERTGIPEEKVAVVRNGPDLHRFTNGEVEPELKGPYSYLVCYLGNMSDKDGVDYLLRSMHHIRHTLGRKDVGCVCMGSGGAFDSLQRLKDELDLDTVRFTGRITDEEVLAYLRTADVCACPDPRNPMNKISTMNKTMEYMAMGKPIVAFDLKETRYSAQEAALYARPNDVEDFARKILALLDDDQLRHEMGRKGRERIEQVLAWKHNETVLVDLYRELLGDPHEEEARQVFKQRRV